MEEFECLSCNHNITDLVNYESLLLEFIECPECKNKMKVEYEESYNSEDGEETTYFWVEPYIN